MIVNTIAGPFRVTLYCTECNAPLEWFEECDGVCSPCDPFDETSEPTQDDIAEYHADLAARRERYGWQAPTEAAREAGTCLPF